MCCQSVKHSELVFNTGGLYFQMYSEHLILVHLGPLEPLVSTEDEAEWMPELVLMLYTPENSPDPANHPLQH